MRSIVIVGNSLDFHVGHHLEVAARQMGLSVKLCNVAEAFEGSFFLRKLNWVLGGHRPPKIATFERKVLAVCHEFQPDQLIATGIAPLTRESLETIKKMGIGLVNYLTDDPWNPVLRAPWFLRAMASYDHVFSPRLSNIEDLKRNGCRKVSYLPFAYSSEVHYLEPPQTHDEKKHFECDVVFVGGADKDRTPYISALLKARLNVHLYGGYWNKSSYTRGSHRGMADARTMRIATGCAKVTLCLVRRSNRDGHCMRSFEAPAMGACMLTEGTEEHRDIFGPEGEAVLYFKNLDEMVKKAQYLTGNPDVCRRLVLAAHELVVQGRHTYVDRLKVMIERSEVT